MPACGRRRHPNPFPHAHIVTTTTHKTLRGPRGGMILTNDKKLAKKIDSAVFPGLQGGPLMHVIAAKAVAFGEALRPEFKLYARQVIDNARALADSLQSAGFKIVSNGTDSHLMLVDLTPKGVSGADAEIALERAGITTNKNGIPFDPLPPMQTSWPGGPVRRPAPPAVSAPGVPPGRPVDRRGSRRGRRRRRQFGGGSQGEGRGPRLDETIPYLQLTPANRGWLATKG